jgi:hypothetical protein
MGGEFDEGVTWSPDSRYLLYSVPTLLTMDIESGTRVIVKEPKGKVCNPVSIGWVSLDVLTEGGGH